MLPVVLTGAEANGAGEAVAAWESPAVVPEVGPGGLGLTCHWPLQASQMRHENHRNFVGLLWLIYQLWEF